MLETLTILANAAMLLGIIAMFVVGAWWRSDPSRDAPARLADARTARDRGEPGTAIRTLTPALSLPRRGRLSVRQAETTTEALALLRELLDDVGAPMPEPLDQLDQQLERGERRTTPEHITACREAVYALRARFSGRDG